jgi:hypothetical protein
MIKLQEAHFESIPIAKIPIETKQKTCKNKAGCFITVSNLEPISLICREANVQINGKKIEPDWGLYNVSMGTVIEIIYGEDENPNDGHLHNISS